MEEKICVPTGDPLPETHLFFILPKDMADNLSNAKLAVQQKHPGD